MSITVRNKIIAELFTSKEFNDCIKKMQPVELQDDLRAEVALILCEKKDEVIIALHNASPFALKYYTVRIILNLIQSKTSPFYKKYRQPIYEYSELFSGKEHDEFRIKNISQYSTNEEQEAEDFNKRMQKELKEDNVMRIIDGLYWYDREILKLYIEKGDYRTVAKELNISWSSIYDTIQMAINKIKYELRTGVSWEVATKQIAS